MNVKVLTYIQNNQKFITTVLPAEILIKISKVLTYNQDPEGYQREANKVHYNKIKNYILDNAKDFILPTSIILGVDKKDIEKNLIEDEKGISLNIDENACIFRIVDGQHRIEGIKKAIEKQDEVKDFSLPVTIVISNENRRSIELEIFRDINSKSKRINTDLAQLAKHNYEILEEKISNLNNHISIKTAHKLKEKKEGVWSNAIKFNIQTDFNFGIIGVTMFSESISKIVESYLKENPAPNTTDKKKIIDFCDKASVFLGDFLDILWSDIIYKKWNAAFTKEISQNEFGEVINTFYSSKYYIQKGIGTNSINSFFAETIASKGFKENSISEIRKKINSSQLKSEDWINGGPFSGYNSGSGFNKIKKLLISSEGIQS
ncbi:DGQHR domain-containing protein [Pedobacter suwonensis]|uniref:DGQHR domain-containing protein n=1 Tax=Pedobacter suwonensis TaxID=332999 RepID=A0A1I0U419_9SPHI|nr:DGQHR domain-containing protein [Pedobacter suwonensis]SFA58587.1 DGQHR domain-containing protein [Pedobacter suwonensis]